MQDRQSLQIIFGVQLSKYYLESSTGDSAFGGADVIEASTAITWPPVNNVSCKRFLMSSTDVATGAVKRLIHGWIGGEGV